MCTDRARVHLAQNVSILQASEEEENESFNYGVCAMQGWRTEMVSIALHLSPFPGLLQTPCALEIVHAWVLGAD